MDDRHVADRWQLVIAEIRVLRPPVTPGEGLALGQAQALRHGALHLALGQRWIQHGSAVDRRGQLEDLHVPGFWINLHFDRLGHEVVRTRLVAIAALVRKVRGVIPFPHAKDRSAAPLIQPLAGDLAHKYTAAKCAGRAPDHHPSIADLQVRDGRLQLDRRRLEQLLARGTRCTEDGVAGHVRHAAGQRPQRVGR